MILKYSLTSNLAKKGLKAPGWKNNILLLLQFLISALLALLCLKPQVVNKDSKVQVEGIDIVLSLDVSGSMSAFDDVKLQKSRFDIAKNEAAKFIDKRVDDQIGLVIFGAQTITLCPLTLDKGILNKFLEELNLGYIDPDGTLLGASLVNACNRLKKSKAKTKIIVLLTDGAPSPGDVPVQIGIDMAKKLKIKVYTIGFGSEAGGYGTNAFGMVVPGMQKINKKLLQKIAEDTGAKFYLAQNQDEVRRVYQDIDNLERSRHEADIYSNYLDLFFPVAMSAAMLMFIYFLLSSFVFFGV